MISYLQAGILGTLQGFAELFPISSLGHTVLLPPLLGWHLDQASPEFVGFVVLTHLATALVLLGFFWNDWVEIVRGVLRSLYMREIRTDDTYARLGWLIIVSTIPVGILGLLFQERLVHLFAVPRLVSLALIGNGTVLYIADRVRRGTFARPSNSDGRTDEALAHLSWRQAIMIGLYQCGALIPGFSRTGLAMTGSLVSGLSYENAARYAFLLATPVIFAAAVLKVPDLFMNGGVVLGQAFFGAVCSAISAYFSIRFLTRYFHTNRLSPFAVYCLVAGIVALLLV
jgi:undecaprenyl-diphosphatase